MAKIFSKKKYITITQYPSRTTSPTQKLTLPLLWIIKLPQRRRGRRRRRRDAISLPRPFIDRGRRARVPIPHHYHHHHPVRRRGISGTKDRQRYWCCVQKRLLDAVRGIRLRRRYRRRRRLCRWVLCLNKNLVLVVVVRDLLQCSGRKILEGDYKMCEGFYGEKV